MARIFQDFIGGELGAALTDSGTTLTSDALAAVDAISSPDYMAITLDPDGIEGAPEIAYITAHTASATTATISRGEEGTTAVAHSSGIEWVAPVTAQDMDRSYGGMVLLDEVELGSSQTSITFSSIPATYADLVIVGRLRSDSAANGDSASLQVGNSTVDSGSNYAYGSLYQAVATSSGNNQGSSGDTKILLSESTSGITGDNATAGQFGSLKMEITAYADTSAYRNFLWSGGRIGGTGQFTGHGHALWGNTSDVIDIVTFSPVNGSNFVSGSYLTLYGRGRA